jgi:hypothetical protein
MNVFKALLGGLAFAVCASSSAQLMGEKGFTITYEWHSSSVPPPHHWQYRIRTSSRGTVDIVMVPGYPDSYDDLPRWRAKFVPTEEQLSALGKLIDGDDYFPKNFYRESMAISPPGSTFCTIHVEKADGSIPAEGEIPCGGSDRLTAAGVEKRDRIVKAVTDLVPAEQWAKLDSLREAYVKAHLNRPRSSRADR